MKVKVNDIEISYRRVSASNIKRTDATLVFIHEALGSIDQWKKFPQELCDNLGLNGIVYERQGHGDSSPLSEPRTDTYLHEYAFNELPNFLRALGEDEKFILVGHSDGGSIALLYAYLYPTNVLAVITMAAHVINEKKTIAGIAPAIKAYERGKLDGLKKYHGDKTNDLFYAWANIWRDPSFCDWDITEEIDADIPYLSIQGKDDQYGTFKQLELIQRYTNAQIEFLANCGHHPHLEQTELTLSLILEFLSVHTLT